MVDQGRPSQTKSDHGRARYSRVQNNYKLSKDNFATYASGALENNHYMRLNMVIYGYTWLYMVIRGYAWLYVAIRGLKWL